MFFHKSLVCFLCLPALFIVVSAQAQDKQLSDAQTFADVAAYMQQEVSKYDASVHDPKENARGVALQSKLAEIFK